MKKRLMNLLQTMPQEGQMAMLAPMIAAMVAGMTEDEVQDMVYFMRDTVNEILKGG